MVCRKQVECRNGCWGEVDFDGMQQQATILRSKRYSESEGESIMMMILMQK